MKECTSFEEIKFTRYIEENVYFGIIIFSFQCLRFLLSCFVWEIKGFYQSSLGNEVGFRDIMNVFSSIVNEVIRGNFKLLYFFFRRKFYSHKKYKKA